MSNIDERCIHCGAYHDYRPEHCLAIKKIVYRPYVYGPDGNTVSHAGIESVEYLSLDDQRSLQRQNLNAKPSKEEQST